MMNSDFLTKCSEDVAARILAESRREDADRIKQAYSIAYGREPSAGEIDESLAFLRKVEDAFSKTEGTYEQHQRSAWNSLCQVILSSNEFIYVK